MSGQAGSGAARRSAAYASASRGSCQDAFRPLGVGSSQAADGPSRRSGTLPELRRPELGRGPRGPVDQVGHPEPVPGQLPVLLRGEPARGQPGEVQRRPEPVARPGEVMPARGRHQREVDAAEEHLEVGSDEVAQPLARHVRYAGAVTAASTAE